MLRIRLARTGRRNQPKYRLVIAEKSEKLNGKVVATVGHYIPTTKEKILVIDKEAISAWLAKGALPSNSVAKLLNTQGFSVAVEMAPVRPAKKAPKEEAPKPAASPEPVVSAEEEAPAEASADSDTPVESAPETDSTSEVVETPEEPETQPDAGVESPAEESGSVESAPAEDNASDVAPEEAPEEPAV